MLDLLQTLWSFVLGLLVLVWDLVVLVTTLVGDSLLHLHVDAPRLEGLLVGVLLSWLLLRRDRHPLLRVLSAPLKLVVDILDLAWDQVVEIVEDVVEVVYDWTRSAWSTVVGWVGGVYDWCKGKVVGAWSWMMDGLRGLKAKLSK